MDYSTRFLLALGFYTRCPVPRHLDYRQLAQAAVFLPIIGWLVGALSGLMFFLAEGFWPQTTAALLALVAGILATGAFHEDGFADVCDGFGGGYGKQRILEIMKDSAIGTYGALGLLLMLALKVSLLATLPAAIVPWLLVAGHSFSRWMPLLLMRRYHYARDENSKSAGAMFRPDAAALLASWACALLPFSLLPAPMLLATIPVVLTALALGAYFNRHIGGYTGDCLGACQQAAETVFYLSASALWTSI